MTYIECAFVNSDQAPILTKQLKGYDVEERYVVGEGSKYVLFGFFEEHYPHPDAPEDAALVVTVRRELKQAKEGQAGYPAMVLLCNAQTNMSHVLKGL